MSKKKETKEKELRPANTFGVQFIIRQDKLRDGKAPVYARITVNGEIIHFKHNEEYFYNFIG